MKNTIQKLRFMKIFTIIVFITFIFNIDIPISYAQDNNIVGTVVDVATAPINWPAKTAGAILGAVGLSPESLALGGLNSILGFLKDFLLFILGKTITPLLTSVMSYQNFFSEGVNVGWDITRNFANLFFALVLLIIAIATVLNIGALSNYTAKRMLPNFIFVALFINFSKAIVGFLIDISQIIMIYFYNSFGPNLSDIIGNASKLAQSGAETAGIDNMSINIFTIIIVSILAFVLLWTILILAVRIVTLWFVIMTSPLAFMANLIPGLGSIYNDWKNKLQEALITGPTLMFLLYLAFALMNNGISIDNIDTGNLMTNGNLINYVLVIGILFFANTTATKAGQSAPGILKNAVGVAGTVATFGLGAYVGAGGYGTRKFADTSVGGITRGVQIVTGGKVKLNSRYEAIKKDMAAANDSGKGLFKGVGQQFSKAGREEQQKDFENARANNLYSAGKLEAKGNERYQKIFNANQAAAASDVKSIENIDKLISDLDKALKDGDKAMAMALSSRISELKSWDQVFIENSKFDSFKDYANKYASEGEHLTNFINDKFGKDANGNVIENNKILNEFKSRQVNILKSKGDDNFTVGLTAETQSLPAEKAISAGILGAGAMFAKNNKIFNIRENEKDADGNDIENTYKFNEKGVASYKLDTSKFIKMIKEEKSIDLLEDPKSWATFGKNRDDIQKAIESELAKPGISDTDKAKLEASLKGLVKKESSKPKNPIGFRTN